MLEAIFELIVPLVMADIIDKGIYNEDKNRVLYMTLVLILLGVVGLVCSITAQYFSAKAAVGFATGVRHSLFSHLLGMSYTRIDTLGTSTMINRMTNDINQLQTGVNMFLRLFLRSPFVVFGALIMAFSIDKKLSLIFVAVIVGLYVIVITIMYFSIPMIKEVQKRLDDVLLLTRQNLSGIRVIRAFCREKREIEDFSKKTDSLITSQQRSGAVSALMNPITYVIVNVGIVVLIWKGAIRVDRGELTQGQVIALYNYLSQILVELIKLANLIITINKALASGHRVVQAFETPNEICMENEADKNLQKEENGINQYNSKNENDNKTMDTTRVVKNKRSGSKPQSAGKSNGSNIPLVEFKNVGFTYHNASSPALEDISFTADNGEMIGIIGGTGSGKSSLVNLIPAFYEADKGEILVNGKDVGKFDRKELLDLMGIVPQKAVLFTGTIRENLLWGNEDADDECIMEALKSAQAADVVESKGGIDAKVLSGGKNFSGGQKQRLTIARALVKRPPILILDDSASALDMATDSRLRSSIRELSYKPLTFIISQRISSIINCDRILVLDDGRIAGIGRHDELLENCEVYREIYRSQE